jgi:hypothetical protein
MSKPTQKPLFEILQRPVIKFAGKEYTSIEYAKIDALLTLQFGGMSQQTAEALVADAEKVCAILSWQPGGDAEPPPAITDEQIAEACKSANCGVPYKVAKVRVRRLKWPLGKAATTPVRKAQSAPAGGAQ